MESTLPQVSLPLSHVKNPRKYTHATANSLAGSSADDEALVRENFPSPYDHKYYENGERRITGKEKAKMGWNFVVLVVVVVLTILGAGAGVAFTVKVRA
jgi:hypothetical protein